MDQSIQTKQIMAGIQTGLASFLAGTGRSAKAATLGMEQYLEDLAPLIEANLVQVAAGGSTVGKANLGFVRDMAVLHAGYLANDFEQSEKAALGAFITSTLTTAAQLLATAASLSPGNGSEAIAGPENAAGGPGAAVAPPAP